jgi:selenide,water dikinase
LVDGAPGEVERDLLCDPQTSGGLLVAAAPGAVDAALAIFRRHGHDAAVIGAMAPGPAAIRV